MASAGQQPGKPAAGSSGGFVLEPWTFPMVDYFRGHKEPFRFFKAREDVAVTDLASLRRSFPLTAGFKEAKRERERRRVAETVRGDKKREELERMRQRGSAHHELQESHVKWKENVLFASSNQEVKYSALNREMHEGYHLHEGWDGKSLAEHSKGGLRGDLLATSVPSTCPYSKLSNPVTQSWDSASGSASLKFSEYKNESESQGPVKSRRAPKKKETKKQKAQKALVALQRARDRVAEADEQQRHTGDWQGQGRREALVAAIHYNTALAVHKARSEAEDDWSEIIELVRVFSEQVHELHRFVRNTCTDSAKVSSEEARSALKDMAIELEAEQREIHQLDNRMLTWPIVAKAMSKLNRLCRKGEYMLFCCDHLWKHQRHVAPGEPEDLPAVLRRRQQKVVKGSRCESKGGDLCTCTHCPPADETTTRSRIDEYYKFVNPEVREARKQKEEWTKMSRPERHRTILDRMAAMRDINDDSTKRLAVRDEAEIREFLEGAAAEREEKEQWWNERGAGTRA